MRRLLAVLAITAVTWAGPDATAADRARTVFVANGEAKLVQEHGAPWARKQGYLECGGKGRTLLAARMVGGGDFHIRARLRVLNLAKSAASFVVSGASHFGFEGSRGNLFLEGPLFGGQKFLGPSGNFLKEGQWIALEVIRTGNTVRFLLDGKEATRVPFSGERLGTIAFRPHRGTMQISHFSMEGEAVAIPSPPKDTVVFHTGFVVEGQKHNSVRIPAIVMTKEGTLLAFAEGRVGGDSGNIDIILRRSTDLGKTWSKPQTVWNDGGNVCGNPCPVVDQDTGIVWLLLTWNLGSDHERAIMAGKSRDVRHPYVTYSKDDGKTWAKPRRIDQARKPHWRWYATGPGNAIQLTRGEHKGRLLIPANHSDHSRGGHPYRSHVVWSDDHGKTWQLGGVLSDRTNEAAVVERSDGSVLLSTRSYHGKHKRAMAASEDAGKTWGDVYLDNALHTPVCQGSILRYSWAEEKDRGGRSRILFSSPGGSGRTHLTVRLSYDEGKTWPVGKVVYRGGSAYSNLITLPDGRIGMLYEKDGYARIVFATFTLDWLTDGKDTARTKD